MAQKFIAHQQQYLKSLTDTQLLKHYVNAYLVPNNALMHFYLQKMADDFLYPLARSIAVLRWEHEIAISSSVPSSSSSLSTLPFPLPPLLPRSAAAPPKRPESPAEFHMRFSRFLRSLLFDPLKPHISDSIHGLLPCGNKGHKMYDKHDGFWMLLLLREMSIRGPRFFRTRHRQTGLFDHYHGPDDMMRSSTCMTQRLLLLVHLFMGYLLHVLRAECSSVQLQTLLCDWSLTVAMLIENGLEQGFLRPNETAFAGLVSLLQAFSIDAPNRGRVSLDSLASLAAHLHEKIAATTATTATSSGSLNNGSRTRTRTRCLICGQHQALVAGYLNGPLLPPHPSHYAQQHSMYTIPTTIIANYPAAMITSNTTNAMDTPIRKRRNLLVCYYDRLKQLKKNRDENWLDHLFS